MFEMFVLTENDGHYDMLSHITRPVVGSDLWNWVTVESNLGPIKEHDNVYTLLYSHY
jgi:hypothetical protein